VLKKHNKTFSDWFREIIFADENASEILRKLADGPLSFNEVLQW